MGAETSLLMMIATLLMVVAGTAKKHLEWRPRPLKIRFRRR
jgi:hypothetical protein